MPSADDEMTIREVGRTLADFRNEMRTALQQLVRADVYRAEQAAALARIAALEKAGERDEAERASTRRLLLGALITAAASVVTSLMLAAILAN